jgi:capsular exopolysaccharide synthesis family protein
MSRIHEALKKAAEERSARLSSGIDADVIQPIPIAPEREENFQTAAQTLFDPHETVPVVLPYEELLKKCVRTTFHVDPRMSVFAEQDPGSVGAERFRTLRSRLYQIASAQTLRKLVITSTVPAEGKTLVAANLAQSIVQQPERRVLLIDADLRASRLHLTFGAQRSPGLADYLRGEADACSVIQKGEDSNLCLIAGGREVSNPSELLLNERLEKLLDLVTPMFDWVILDAPPALPVHDASIIADLCDGVLFVVRAGETDSQVAAKVLEDFKQKNLVGVVLNRVERGDGYGGYYYSYPSYGSKSGKS